MPLCKFLSCTENAVYNIPNDRKKLYCKIHKKKNMIPILNRLCIVCFENGIQKRASYNIPSESRCLYCKEHKTDNMINVNSKKYLCKGCNKKQPMYGKEKDKRATHCSSCKEDGMIDLVSNLCKYKGCRKNATYGILGSKVVYCKTHSNKGMIDVKNKKCVICKKNNLHMVRKEIRLLIANHVKKKI